MKSIQEIHDMIAECKTDDTDRILTILDHVTLKVSELENKIDELRDSRGSALPRKTYDFPPAGSMEKYANKPAQT